MHLPTFAVATLFCLTYAFSPAVLAMDVDGYEQLVRRSESRDPKTEPFMAKATVNAYFSGMAQTIQLAQTGSQAFQIGERKVLCFPSQVRLTPELLRGVLDAELKSPEFLREALGPKWREVQLPFVVSLALKRMFPCPTE